MNHEVKLAAPRHHWHSILAVTKALLPEDTQFPSNQITSLYFDTADWALADEKAASTYHKTKVRVRFYDDLQQNTYCFAEIKGKEGATRNKVRRELPSTLLHPQNQHELISEVNAFLIETLGYQSEAVFPAFYISYKRHRFFNPSFQTRIAIDSGIVAIAHQGCELSQSKKYRLSNMVLEQKGEPRALTPDLSALTRFSLRPEAFSKYYLGYCGLTGYRQ